MARIRECMLAPLLAWLVTGCTTVVVNNADGSTHTERHAGVMHLTTGQGRLPQIVSLHGVGLTAQNGAITLGFARSDYVILPTNDCRVVVWLGKDTPVPEFVEGLGSQERSVCFVGPGVVNQEEKKR